LREDAELKSEGRGMSELVKGNAPQRRSLRPSSSARRGFDFAIRRRHARWFALQ
jgi:hypothetical protein